MTCTKYASELIGREKGSRLEAIDTPDAYRAKWGLPATYPMVAHDYSIMASERRKGVPRGKKLSKKRRHPQKAGV